MLAPDLFKSLDPPTVTAILHRLERPEHDERLVSLSILGRGVPGLHAGAWVSRYSPEHGILRAIEATVEALTVSQCNLTEHVLKETFRTQLGEWVEPF